MGRVGNWRVEFIRNFNDWEIDELASFFLLQLLGYDVDLINSVQFSNHTGKLLLLLHPNRLRNSEA